MNIKHPNTRFTIEIEKQHTFYFQMKELSETLRKKTFETSVYRIKTNLVVLLQT